LAWTQVNPVDAHTVNDLTWRVVLKSALASYTLETAKSILINSYHMNEMIRRCSSHNYRIGPYECSVFFFSYFRLLFRNCFYFCQHTLHFHHCRYTTSAADTLLLNILRFRTLYMCHIVNRLYIRVLHFNL
jgi:hypothetical protein